MSSNTRHDHVVDFYVRDERLVQRVNTYLSTGLQQGAAAVVVATPEHLAGIEDGLRAAGTDLDAAREAGLWTALDAGALLRQLRPHGELDERLFEEQVGSVVRSATGHGRPARVYGEMVQLLWEAGDVNGAIALESVWNDMGRDLDFSLYCAYRDGAGPARAEAVDTICQLHSEVAYRHGLSWSRSLEAAFPNDPASPSAARRFLAEVQGEWGLSSLPDGADLVLTELATNALLHAGSDFRVVICQRPYMVRISVHDASRDLPARYASDVVAFSGRGLFLVEALSSEWGFSVRPDGKEVWADLPLDH